MISIFELFKIGVGPSSSHTVGPMLAGQNFVQQLPENVSKLTIELFGALALTGKGHGTDRAVLAGLENQHPETVDTNYLNGLVNRVSVDKYLKLPLKQIKFDITKDLFFHMSDQLPYHPNGMRFTAMDDKGNILIKKDYYSIGGGFILSEDEIDSKTVMRAKGSVPFQFQTAAKLMSYCKDHHCSIADIVLENELHWYSRDDVEQRIDKIWQAMSNSIENGMSGKGLLPGSLKVKRRAPLLYQAMQGDTLRAPKDVKDLNWLNIYAMAVNEENAAGNRIVTSPTNGASGTIPAVLQYYLKSYPDASPKDVHKFLLTAGGICILYKQQASISGAEMGCQGEVGVACSMAAAGLAAVLGGTPQQVEQAAEIGMEHHLGLTCDPVGGLVQVPCIERNAMAAVHAVNAANIALLGDGEHVVSLDQVIQTMKQTGEDMHSNYKETALGGLAVNVPNC